MTKILQGRCLCGEIRFEIRGESLGSGQCYCRDCRYICGGGPANAFVVFKSDLKLIKGEPQAYESETHTGGVAKRQFCGTCGTPVFGSKTSSPETVAVFAGTLQDDSSFKPQAISWASSAPHWAVLDSKIPAFPRDIGASDS